MNFTFREILLHTIGLIALFSPMAAIAPFIDNTARFSRSIQKRISLKVTVYAALFLALGGWLGEYLLRLLGITLAALQASGGFILLLSSIPMVLQGTNSRQNSVQEEHSDEDWKSVVFIPILFPITIGAASLSYMIMLMGQTETFLEYLGIAIIIVLDAIVIFTTYFFAGPIGERIGNTGNNILIRVGGIVVMALGFSILSSGLKILLPGLG